MAHLKNRTALLVGASGLVGAELLKLLLSNPDYDNVFCVGRRALTHRHAKLIHPKLNTHVMNLAQADLATQFAALPKLDDVYCALGTTIKVAGSPAAFKAIDLEAVVAVAKAAVQVNRATHLGVVSAMGASTASGIFYNRVKGEMETAVAKLGFQSVSIARPSMLAGDRESLHQPSRPGEQIGLKLMAAASFMIPADYRAIQAADVARALHAMVTEGRAGLRIALSGELRAMAQAR